MPPAIRILLEIYESGPKGLTYPELVFKLEGRVSKATIGRALDRLTDQAILTASFGRAAGKSGKLVWARTYRLASELEATVAHQFGVIAKNLLQKYDIDHLPASYSKRVFVGGSYRDLPTLREICKYVRQCGFFPVLTADFNPPKIGRQVLLNIHDLSVLLLNNCRIAFFEITDPAGQYQEIEWALRLFKKETYGFCKSRTAYEPIRGVSDMVKSLFEARPVLQYTSFDHLRRLIRITLRMPR